MNLDDLKNKTLLLFGKPRAFSLEEFHAQMKHHTINVVSELSDDVILSIDGRMMTPYEQIKSDELYEKGIVKSMSIDALESQLVKEIDADTLLMSLKLSHDTERLKSFIQNSMIDDTLFFRLIQMYNWQGEDFYENDDNRDVSAAFISRFYENIEQNHNVQYATTGFIHLVSQAKDSKLLQLISQLEPLQFHPKIKSAIAMSPFCYETLQKQFLKRGDAIIYEALSLNKTLSHKSIEKLLEDENLAQNIAQSIELTEELFVKLEKYVVSLAHNETLTTQMQEKLLALDDVKVKRALASNAAITQENIEKLLSLEDEAIKQILYENSATPQALLNAAYKDEKNHEALAKNENTPIEILYQLQLDSRYERYVKTNAGFGKHIQSENIGWMVE